MQQFPNLQVLSRKGCPSLFLCIFLSVLLLTGLDWLFMSKIDSSSNFDGLFGMFAWNEGSCQFFGNMPGLIHNYRPLCMTFATLSCSTRSKAPSVRSCIGMGRTYFMDIQDREALVFFTSFAREILQSYLDFTSLLSHLTNS